MSLGGLWKCLHLLKPTLIVRITGVHKHFRIIALHDYIQSSGCTSRQDEHTRIPGIWEKLHSLYNLSILDERVSIHRYPMPRSLHMEYLEHPALRFPRFVISCGHAKMNYLPGRCIPPFLTARRLQRVKLSVPALQSPSR